jgi:uncharacterized protein
MWGITWTVKASKLCNLRCLYCYEWESLSDRARIPVAGWAKILVAVRRYHEILSNRFGESGRTTINWHGGEPLLLPFGYMEDVLGLERKILGHSALQDGTFANFMQTNLYALDAERMDLLRREGFELGVSFDMAPGMRLTRAGRQTEERVLSNLRRVLAKGVPVWGVVVLAAHTVPRLREICDFFRDLGIPVSLSPLSQAPLNVRGSPFAMTDPQVLAALQDLFVHWWEGGATSVIEPLREYLQTALMRMTELQRLPYDRRQYGDRVIVVDTDGSLYPVVDRYVAGRSIGNVLEQPLDEILASSAYSLSLQREDTRRTTCCGDCHFLGACDTYPAFSTPQPSEAGRCRIAWEMQSFIEDYIDWSLTARAELQSVLAKLVVSRLSGAPRPGLRA